MHHVVLVRVRQRVNHPHQIPQLYGQWQNGPLLDNFVEAVPFEILHSDEWSILLVPQFVNRDDIGMLQRSRGTCFLIKTIQKSRLGGGPTRDGF